MREKGSVNRLWTWERDKMVDSEAHRLTDEAKKRPETLRQIAEDRQRQLTGRLMW